MGRIKRSVKFYNVWGSYGSPVPNSELGILIEQINGVDTAVMTIDEDNSRLSDMWDSGFSENSDMRSYPRPISGSGGAITLTNSGWYTLFTSLGYSFNGCRVSRNWEEGGSMALGNHIVSEAKVGVGVIALSLSLMSATLAADVADAPLVVGEWKNVEVQSEGDGETLLFDGLTFYAPNNSISQRDNEYGRPIRYVIDFSPSDETDINRLEFPQNSFARVVGGRGKGAILSIDRTSVSKVLDGKYTFGFGVGADFGMYIDDEDTVGLVDGVQLDTTIEDMSIFQFFTSNTMFKTGNDTELTNAKDEDGNNVFVEPDGDNYVLPMSATRYDALSMEYPVIGGPNIFSKLSSGDATYYDQESGTYARTEELLPLVTSVGTLPLRDYDRDTHIAVGGTESFAFQRRIETPNIDAKGMLLDFSIAYDYFTFDDLVVNVKCVAEWSDEGEFNGIEHYEVLLDKDINFGAGLAGVYATCDFFNFAREYYVNDDSEKSLVGAQLDDRTGDSRSWSSKRYLAGVSMLEFDNIGVLQNRPKHIYFIITTNLDIKSTMYIKEMGLYGDVTEPPSGDITITGDLQGKTGLWATMSGAIGNIAAQQNFSLIDSVNIDIEFNDTPVKTYITDQTDLLTTVALETIQREAWYLGGLSRDASTWSSKSVAGMIGEDTPVQDSHYFRVPRKGLSQKALSFDSVNVPNSGTLYYGAGGEFKGHKITISNVDMGLYQDSYITGISDPQSAESLWNMAHLIWLKTKTVVEMRSDISTLKWIYRETDAVDYLVNLFDWNGGKGFSRNVLTASFEVANIDSTLDFWDIGDPCRAYIPTITVTGDYSGVVTGVQYRADDYSAVITCRVGQINQAIPTLKEVGITGEEVETIVETDIFDASEIKREIGVL